MSTSGNQGNAPSENTDTSADGQWVVFDSFATGLVSGDTNSARDIFIRDRSSGTTIRILTSTGAEPNGHSSHPAISPNGRFVAFESIASNLVPSDTNNAADIFVLDRDTDTDGMFDEAGFTSLSIMSKNRVGTSSNFGSHRPDVADDGHTVFETQATDILFGDTNGTSDIAFTAYPPTNPSICISAKMNGDPAGGTNAKITADAFYVVFDSYSADIVSGDSGTYRDVFLWEGTSPPVLVRISETDNNVEGNGDSSMPAIPAYYDFDFKIPFISTATNLATSANGNAQVILAHGCVGGCVFDVVSVDSGGTQGNSGSTSCAISSDSRYVSFASNSSNLVSGDSNGVEDVFVHDRATGETRRASTDSVEQEADGASAASEISDVLTLSFHSDATDLVSGDTNTARDAFVHRVPSIVLNGTPSSGSTVSFTIDNANNGETAWVLLSSTGYGPTALPNGGGNIYITVDSLTNLGLQFGSLMSATIGATGQGTTSNITLPSIPTGVTVYAAAYLVSGSQIVGTTTPTSFVTQ